jgi:hypothetical protein
MRHTFRLNVFGKGYTLYSGLSTAQNSYLEFPLDVVSEGISPNYIFAQKRIDSMLTTSDSRWNFCIANLNPSRDQPVVAYGCLLPVEVMDDRGRRGITFVHGIECDKDSKIDYLVISISQILSYKVIGEISNLLSGLAKGHNNAQATINFLTKQFIKSDNQFNNTLMNLSNPIKEIDYDCGGASATAWLAMAISHLNDPNPWEIYERYKASENMISIISSSPKASKKFLLSNYLYESICTFNLTDKSSLAKPGKVPYSSSNLQTSSAKNNNIYPDRQDKLGERILNQSIMPNLSGQWEGKLNQVNSSNQIEFIYKLNLTQINDSVTGESRLATLTNEYYLESCIKDAKLNGYNFKFSDGEVIASKAIDGASWCKKLINLTYETNDTLVGFWKENSLSWSRSSGQITLYRLSI